MSSAAPSGSTDDAQSLTPRHASTGLCGAFHSECTVCGQCQAAFPQLTCLYCHSKTHTACAQTALSVTRLCTAELGADRLAALAVATGTRSGSHVVGRTSGAAALMAHPPRHRVPTDEIFFCSTDCALCVTLYENPTFSPEISDFVEEEMAQRWQALTPDPQTSLQAWLKKREQEEESDTSLSGSCTMSTAAAAAAAARSATSLVEEALYFQLRYDAWCRYITLERASHAPPTMFPPSHFALAEEVVIHISELLSASGQAERLHMSNARVGCLVALPHDMVWRGAKRVRPGETNNFLAETEEQVMATSLEPKLHVTRLFKRKRKTFKDAPTGAESSATSLTRAASKP